MARGSDKPSPRIDDSLLLGHDELEARSRIAAHLRPSIWPADRAGLLACAEEMHAPTDVLDRLRQLPEGTFSHTEAVWKALGGRVELRP